MKKNSSLFKFFSLKLATMFALAVAAILTLVLASCAPIPESERLPPLQPGYGRIIVNTGGVGSRAVTDADKKDARLDVSFNGVSYGHTLHATFKVGTDVRIVVKAYRVSTDPSKNGEFIGYGTASHTMTYGTNQVTVDIYKVDGYYKVTYEYGDALLGGTYDGITADKTYYKGGEDEVIAPSADDVTWQHGTLSGWTYNDGSGDQTVGASDDWTFPMPSADITLTAQWTRYKYDFTYEDNIPDGKNGTVTGKPQNQSQQDALTKITIENATPTLTIANEAWNFKGYWTDNPEGNGTHYSAGQEITLTKNITLYAQWTNEAVWRVAFAEPTAKPTAYTTNMPQGNIVQQGKQFTWTANPAARGWSFDGWDVTGSSTISSPLSATTTQVTPDADITLTARWTPIPYTIKFNTGSGSSVSDIANFTVNGSDSFAANPTYTGYTFGGWQYNNTPIADAAALRTAITNGSVTASGNNEITLTAQWTANTYKVKYEPNAPSGATVMLNGATATTQEVERTYGQSFSWATNMFTAPTGYSFAGWREASTGTGTLLSGNASSTYTQKDGDITVYAQWTVNKYTITVDGNGVSGLNNPFVSNTYSIDGSNGNQQISLNTSVPSNADTYNGKIFDGWAYTDTGAKITDATINVSTLLGEPTAKVSGNVITLYAVWKNAAATVTEGGTETIYDTFTNAWNAANGKTATIKLYSDPTGVAQTLSSGTVTLNLNGHTLTGDGSNRVITISAGSLTLEDNGSGKITGGKASSGGCINVANGATFIMKGGTITGNTATNYGGGVYNEGTFTMSGGAITNNSGVYGGGVYNKNIFNMDDTASVSENEMTGTSRTGGVHVEAGTFTMRNGAISGNRGGTGCGVYVRGRFDMQNGTISGHTTGSHDGAGVYIYNGEFNMYGGTICDNTTTGNGGGVFVDSNKFTDTEGVFTMTAGTITRNTANIGGGVAVNNKFHFNGGTISENAASVSSSSGTGGVHVYQSSTFDGNGNGTLSNNTPYDYSKGSYTGTGGDSWTSK